MASRARNAEFWAFDEAPLASDWEPALSPETRKEQRSPPQPPQTTSSPSLTSRASPLSPATPPSPPAQPVLVQQTSASSPPTTQFEQLVALSGLSDADVDALIIRARAAFDVRAAQAERIKARRKRALSPRRRRGTLGGVNKRRRASSESEPDVYFTVERLEACRLRVSSSCRVKLRVRLTREYLVKWRNFSESEKTWEPSVNILDRALIEAWRRTHLQPSH
jgi:hypothetical protein